MEYTVIDEDCHILFDVDENKKPPQHDEKEDPDEIEETEDVTIIEDTTEQDVVNGDGGNKNVTTDISTTACDDENSHVSKDEVDAASNYDDISVGCEGNGAEVDEEPMDLSIDEPKKEYPYDFKSCPLLITECRKELQNPDDPYCCLRGCKWAPDGLCILVASDDQYLRLFNIPNTLVENINSETITQLPEMESVLKIAETGPIYDYAWYPQMNSSDPTSCCLISATKDNPLHLWDAYTGQLRCSYYAYNNVDEVTSAYSVSFDPWGQKLFAGYKNAVRIFRVGTPSRKCDIIKTNVKKGFCSQPGIISCICINPAMHSMIAAGSYLNSIALYDDEQLSPICLLEGHAMGLTHLMFSPDGTKLYSGCRKNSEMLCWDLRNPGKVLYSMTRTVETNQRIYFDLTNGGHYLLTGNTNNRVRVWDLESCSTESDDEIHLQPLQEFVLHNDCVNGVSFHNQYPILATTSGQRHFPDLSQYSDDDDCDGKTQLPIHQKKSAENRLGLWWMGSSALTKRDKM